MNRLIGLMKRTDKVETCQDWMSGIAERHYDVVVFDGFSFRYDSPRRAQESINAWNVDGDIALGDVAQIVYRGSHVEAIKAVPEQIEEFDKLEKERTATCDAGKII